MSDSTLRAALAVLIVLFAAGAAFCWFRAGTVKVSPDEADKLREAHMSKHGRTGYAAWTFFDGSDMEFTLAAQSKWNRYGALAAGAAAAVQALYVYLTEFGTAG